MLNELAETSAKGISGGVDNSADEMTLAFQGAAAGLKQNCGKYKSSKGYRSIPCSVYSLSVFRVFHWGSLHHNALSLTP